jgi:iron complex transport system substrate-binding protein
MTATLLEPPPLSEIVEDVTRREFLSGGVALALAAGLAACADDGPAPTAGETRAVRHAFGATDIPANPRRVVVARHFWLESVLALGLPVVGAVTDSPPRAETGGFTLSAGAEHDVSGITVVGEQEPNLEAVARLDPDLIVLPVSGADAGEDRDLYERLVRIAPTVAPAAFGAPSSRQAARLMAEATGQEPRLAALDERYDREIAELRALVNPLRDDLTVSVVQFLGASAGQFRIPGEPAGYPFVEVMADAGIPRTRTQVGTSDDAQDVSYERLPDHDGDVFAVVCFHDTQTRSCEELFTQPLFPNLNAARLGQTHVVAGNEWGGGGYAGLFVAIAQFRDLLDRPLNLSADIPGAVPQLPSS